MESGVSTQESGGRSQYAGVRSQESAMERRFERADTAYSQRAPQIFLVGARLRTRPLTPCRPYETDASERRPYQHHLVGARLRTRPPTHKYGQGRVSARDRSLRADRTKRTPRRGVPTNAFGHRRRHPYYNGSAILTVVPSPILLEIVIFPPSSAVRRSMPESP